MESIQLLNAKELCDNICRPRTSETFCLNYNPTIMLVLYIILVVVAGIFLFKFLYKKFLRCLYENNEVEISGEGNRNKSKKYKRY